MSFTNLTITTKEVIIQTEGVNSVTVQAQETKAQEKNEPLFMLRQTPYERFLSKLFERNIIDHTGKLLIDLKDFHPTTQHLDQLNAAYLEQAIYIEIGDTDNFYKHLVLALKWAHIIDNQNKLTWGP